MIMVQEPSNDHEMSNVTLISNMRKRFISAKQSGCGYQAIKVVIRSLARD